MKKFAMLFAVVAVAGAIGTASAIDRTGKIGLGYQEQFLGTASNTLGSWSLKYGFSPAITGQLVVGFDFGNKGFNAATNFGGRVLYNLVTNENSSFYTGLGFGWNHDEAPVEARFLEVQLPLGFEFSFAGLPEVGISAEVGVVWDYLWTAAGKQSQFKSAGGNYGGQLGLGIHYYF